ncbi:Glutathione transport system permease protein GsiC [Corynebacterium provencense]|uniref:Glutathione transport system permease protein GsiC n=1 Tax=Corynebacterium provencense TaxID=1737425 RepID=A0A2Z3YUT3_9CORY|nr:ABC transporter permease [Corynebacterium provencense]AWT26960.1 Glutathione transport system permease protein GsiC [Corynebacterium provencense]
MTPVSVAEQTYTTRRTRASEGGRKARINLSFFRRLTSRLVTLVLVLFIVSVLAFLLGVLGPGDPIEAQYGNTLDQAQLDTLRDAYGLNDPLVTRYANWAGALFTAGGGTSLITGRAVFDVLGPAFLNTLVLTAASGIVFLVLGTFIGFVAGYYHGTWIDRGVMLVVQIGSNLSVYWFGLVLVSVFALRLQWLPVGGMTSRGSGGIADLLVHLILPSFSAALISLLVLARFVRIGVVRESSSGYYRLFRSQGFSRARILRSNVLRNILPSIVTISGLEVGTLITGVFFVEIVFNWPGIGTQLVNAVNSQDYPVIQTGIVLVAACYLVINLFTDLIVDALNPRLRRAS